MKTIKLLFLGIAAICSGLFCSCVNSKPPVLSSSNPAYYNPDSREFEARWPFGPAGYR
jgi:hypothetical protein